MACILFEIPWFCIFIHGDGHWIYRGLHFLMEILVSAIDSFRNTLIAYPEL